MAEKCFCHMNGYQVKDAVARSKAETLETATESLRMSNDENGRALAEMKSRMDNFAALPEGSTSGDAELIDMRTGYKGEPYASAGAALRGQTGDLATEAKRRAAFEEENRDLLRYSDGHFFRIYAEQTNTMQLYREDNGVVTVESTTKGSDFIKCPKYLCFEFPNASTVCRINFYDLADGKYTPRWDIVNILYGPYKNYVRLESAREQHKFCVEIPEGVYMQFSAPDTVKLFAWDGVAFGMPVQADCSYPKTNGTYSAFSLSGDFGVTLPGTAKYIIATGCDMYVVHGYKGGSSTVAHKSYATKFLKLPEGYDYFRLRAVPEGDAVKHPAGNINDMISIVVKTEAEKPAGRALEIIKNCEKVCNIRWTPAAELKINSKTSLTFKAGIEYKGIPYGSCWRTAHFVGWHVSPHTFVNAANDPDSIFFKESVDDGEVKAPYYSLVCSSFATMCSGWPYPQINGGYFYDKNVELYWSDKPPIGSVFTNIGHVVIPARIDYMENSVAVTAYESMKPTSQRSTRTSTVKAADDIGYYDTVAGDRYYNGYGWVAFNSLSNPYMENIVPYIGGTHADTTVINGDARPYKGDKSVYTSAEPSVIINIKDTSAETLYLENESETVSINLDGAKQIDVKPYIKSDGLYSVYTEKNETHEHFEYRTVNAIHYKMINGVPVLDSKDFWYVMFMMYGDPRNKGNGKATAQLPEDDYSYLIKNGATCGSVYSAFKKGAYGAYAIPVVRDEN